MRFLIHGGTSLVNDEDGSACWSEADINLSGTHIGKIGVLPYKATEPEGIVFDADGLLVLPGIVDIHGDAFERQIQPRPETVFAHDIALADTDRQLIANGITTACHGLTYSWEGGLRGRDAALALMDQIESQRATLHSDHRIHLRYENHHIDGLQDVLNWIAQDRIDFLAFNEHLPSIERKCARPEKLAGYTERARCDTESFRQRVRAARSRSAEVPGAVGLIAAVCRACGIPMASHDDETRADREHYQALGVGISEFPRTQDALSAAMALGNKVVMGAPNVLLGGSHCGGLAAFDAVKSGRCDMLASDYYYPSLLHAAFRLTREGACSLIDAWSLISKNPATALGMNDRGRIADGCRADLVLVDVSDSCQARLIATIAAGKLAYCAEPQRIMMQPVYSLAA